MREFVAKLAQTNPYPAFEKNNRTDNFTFSATSPLNPRTLQESVRALGQLRDRFPSLQKYPQMMEKITPAQLEIVGQNYLSALGKDAGDAKRITDKLLTNYFFVGLIHLLYPKAKFVHTARDPVDTCLSGFTKLFKYGAVVAFVTAMLVIYVIYN